ncbi:serine hydrolase domain-containing protein [Zymomonas mobilis]|uniref:Beta-lactamase n=1 Tax=Zymomonas mobilis subsp. mobilis (strain ATCC 10988 / DSM 424 / LMG 404 / NCIMB 8938 / NRRL B-806 / ZM1) TaxID=555217 RepID=A0A0H3G573_ZYMMA|nr:serine hydrolase domain-containing protein [Zymomonas mobilis]AEH62255.1 beta-lactamase [Zymomonas mobilis subsp. mobilis ATCC 10988]TQL28151.1 CubicO group peptidase (beta-lactamase class C family) [Zymomonas mobilis]TQL30086.1 CubicO group peptidase (beta-lactamase class C family) [Zymomonas mobilis]
MAFSERLGNLAKEAFRSVGAFVAEGKISGAALGVITADGRKGCYLDGFAQIIPQKEKLTRQHYFDLASLTKVMATTPAILKLVDDGIIDLDQPLTKAIPDLRQYEVGSAYERTLTFRDCLTHNTRLPAVEPIYTYGSDPNRLRHFILQRKWEKTATPVYSDINFMLLGIALERLHHAPLITLPLPKGLTYTPPTSLAVATENCVFRHRVLKGEVHDENAWALGGAAGHAGLFGTVDAVLDFAQSLLNGQAASPKALEAIRRVSTNPKRTLGWECKFDNWAGGQACSDQSIGHTGFTGTGLWIDFDRSLAWTLLTNRVHPTRFSGVPMQDIRRKTGNAVIAGWDSALSS